MIIQMKLKDILKNLIVNDIQQSSNENNTPKIQIQIQIQIQILIPLIH